MNVGGFLQNRKTTLFGSRQSSPANTPKHRKPVTTTTTTTNTTTKSRLCCRDFDFNDCMNMGSIVSKIQGPCQQHQSQQPVSKLEQQVADLEREVQQLKEHKAIYKKGMERTQDYLRHCLQIAQDNGFLDLILKNNRDDQQGLVSPNVFNVNSPQVPNPVHQHSDLAALIDQAKMTGWYIEPQEIELREKIAQGSTADIYKATWRGLDIAVKCIYPDFFLANDNGVTFFAQELETLCRQRHRFVLQLMGACLNPPNFGWVVTEFLATTLKEWLHGHGARRREREVPLPPLAERVGKAVEIAQGMQYLHEQKPMVVHRDLKPSNIFLDDCLHVRVADFGHARFLSDEEKALSGETGTYVYMAPEVIRCEPYNEKCDVYSFGIVLNELITGDYPYIETDYGPAKIAVEVGDGKLRPELPQDNGQVGELINLICLSWDEDAYVRPSFATITSTLRKIQKTLIETI